MEIKLEIGTKVKVLKPCSTSANEVGLIGFITEIEEGELSDFGPCTHYRICRNKNCIHDKDHSYLSKEYEKQGWWEHASSLEIIK